MTEQGTARADTFALQAGHGDAAIFRRLHAVLESARAVAMGEACWTREGARYLRIPYPR